MAGVVSINFLSSTQCPPWLMATISGGFALIAAAVAWTFHWRSYYVLALIGLSLAPKHPAEHAPATAASPGGWLLILASFVVLGLAVLISHWKARESSAVRSEP
jgi:hypothetical protein